MPKTLTHQLLTVAVDSRTGQCTVCGVVRIVPSKGTAQRHGPWACGRKPPLLSEEQRSQRMKERNYTKRMGRALLHQLSDINEERRTGTCAVCGFVRVLQGKGTRQRLDSPWTCARRPPDRVGGKTTHVLSDINPQTKTGTCALCGPVALIWRPYQNGGGRWGCVYTRHTVATTAYRYDANYKRAICPHCNQWHRWDRGQGKLCRERLEQDRGNQCEVCHDTPNDGLRVDHDHQTGAVRGLLCRNCNVALGLLKDSRERVGALLDYLSR